MMNESNMKDSHILHEVQIDVLAGEGKGSEFEEALLDVIGEVGDIHLTCGCPQQGSLPQNLAHPVDPNGAKQGSTYKCFTIHIINTEAKPCFANTCEESCELLKKPK